MKETLVQVYGIWYIDPVRLLADLSTRVSLITERIAVPGTDFPTTEGLRGRRCELLNIIQQLKEIIK